MVRLSCTVGSVKMRPYIVINLIVYSMILYNCSEGIFLFKTIKPKLYPFVSAYSGIEEENHTDETRQQEEQVQRLDPKKWAWIVVIHDAAYNLAREEIMYNELCLGVLITRSDVLTTCWCVKGDQIRDEPRKKNLVVTPKTTVVPWDKMTRAVTNVLLHESCSTCNGETSYNNLALLTVEMIQVIYGVIETLPRHFYKTKEGEQPEVFRNNLYDKCYIVVKDSDSPVEDHSRLSPLPMSKRKFTPWDFTSPKNDLGTKTVVGRSAVLPTPELRYPGSPLICRNKQNNREEPVGIYMGLVCTQKKIDLIKWKKNCLKQLHGCEDCFPRLLFHVKYTERFCREGAFEMVMTFDNLGDWLEEDTFEILQRNIIPYYRSRALQQKPSFWNIFIFIGILVLALLI